MSVHRIEYTIYLLTRRTAKTTEIDALRFTNRDLNVVGTLEYGQFGVVRVFHFISHSTLIEFRSMWSLATSTVEYTFANPQKNDLL